MHRGAEDAKFAARVSAEHPDAPHRGGAWTPHEQQLDRPPIAITDDRSLTAGQEVQ
jgi:hypothetical protein